jgi:hypothetical protein
MAIQQFQFLPSVVVSYVRVVLPPALIAVIAAYIKVKKSEKE